MEKNLNSLIISGLLIISCNQSPDHTTSAVNDKKAVEAETMVRDGIFIHISECYNDPHCALMPLKMAVMMSEDKDVLVYMDIHAVHLLVKGSEDLKFADFESAHSYIKQLTDKGVGVYACPTCLKIAGFKPEDLMEGVRVAQKEKFFNFTQGRIITLDY
jgi:predicted peroxiredoxin